MKFPNLVYKKGGPHKCKGGTYDYLAVTNAQDLEKALKNGYVDSLESITHPEDYNARKKAHTKEVSKETNEETVQEVEISREELELRAKELGIKFRNSVTDEALAAKIAEVESEGGKE